MAATGLTAHSRTTIRRALRIAACASLAILVAIGHVAIGPATSAAPNSPAGTVYEYPPAPPGTVTDTYFGTEVADPYRWLEDPQSPATRAWVDAEAGLTRRYLDSLPSLPARTRQVDALLDMPTWSAPTSRGDRTFWTEQPAGSSHAVIMWSHPGGRPTVLVDPVKAPGSGPVSVAAWSPSPDGRFVAWAASESGSDWRTIHVVRVFDGRTLSDTIVNARYTGIWWTPDSRAFAYQAYPSPASGDAAATGAQLRYHVLGTPVGNDVVLLENPDRPAERYWICCDTGEGKVVMVLNAEQWSFRWMNALKPGEPITELFSTSATVGPTVVSVSGRSVLLRDIQGAPLGRIVRVDVDAPDPANWVTVVPEQPDSLDSATVVQGRLVLTYLHEASSQLRIVGLDGAPGPRVALPGIGTTGYVTASPGRQTAYLTYSSFNQPAEVLGLDVRSGDVSVWRKPNPPFDPADFVTTSATLPGKDGTPVHAFIVRRRDVVRNGSNPTLLFGYGGFNISLTPEYRAEWLAWAQSGGVFVYANLRGGGEYGKDWYLAGTRLTKQRTFDDFISVAEWLKARGWTDTRHLAISGRSNGGLLVGAVMTQRPDIAAVAIPQVGVLDMLRYQRFTIGASWATNYGLSDESPEMFQALYAYSPVHNLRPGVRYPATLITTAESDDRVVPAHSYKFAATLQADNGSTTPALIRIERGAGHGAGATREQAIAQIADRLAFIDANLGIAPVEPTPQFRRSP